jgi:hypothetical protein
MAVAALRWMLVNPDVIVCAISYDAPATKLPATVNGDQRHLPKAPERPSST